ncbi:MAG TPA: sigma-70 family RNA polymerase sigma factor [Candidatus Acidoferrales bacterium]|nr:sigma-70 family RNA polymerase sigma factor [Candidatus Acidoferrales bacterium]
MANVPKLEVVDRRPLERSPEAAADERTLVRQAQAGEVAAYEKLLAKHQQRVFAVVGGILRRREDIEDVAQQVFVKAYFSLKRFDLRSAFGTWLYKIAVNECWDYLRKKKVRRLVYEADLSEEQTRHLASASEQSLGEGRPREDSEKRTEQRELIERLLAELDEQDRLMLIMKEVEGFSVEEIGQILGINVNTVKVRLFRARGKLVEIYRRRVRSAVPSPKRAGSAGR